MQYLSVDRIVGEIAVCEDENRAIIKVPLTALPPGTREGSVLRKTDGEYKLDQTEEARRRHENASLFKSLMKEGSHDGDETNR